MSFQKIFSFFYSQRTFICNIQSIEYSDSAWKSEKHRMILLNPGKLFADISRCIINECLSAVHKQNFVGYRKYVL